MRKSLADRITELEQKNRKPLVSAFANASKRESDWNLLKQKALDDNNLELLKDIAEIELK